ncbi:unnamed protein product [Heterobilharzia americana]|nr:unnamed protein product [Heterobilharzia americana]CAH8447079.1 unnamed protein product [Heterobilharzia americana]
MSCPTCENPHLVEDENTGQLICTECGTATGIFRGVTQSQDFCETRGLRVIQKSEILIKQLNSTNADNLETMRLGKVEPDSTFGQTTTSIFRDRMLDTSGDMFTSDDMIFSNITEKDKFTGKNRPWRLSEPFTFIMKCQAISLVKELNLSVEEKASFCNTVLNIWRHYLAITGELGSDVWLDAACLLMKPTSEVFRSRKPIVKGEKRSVNVHLRRCKESHKFAKTADAKTTNHYKDEWEFIVTCLRQFHWLGWSTLYEPDEGREIVNVLHMSQKKKPKKTKATGEKTKLVKCRRKRKRGSECDSFESDCDSVEEHLKGHVDSESQHNEQLSNCTGTSEMPNPVDSDLSKTTETDQFSVWGYGNDNQNALSSYFTKKLSQSQSMTNLFWRGQIEGGFNCRALMEHNISVLFIACLTMSPVRKAFNPLLLSSFINCDFPNIPCALTTMITLKDLRDLCISHRLPFTSVESLFPPGAYCIRDQSLLSLIRRPRPPEIDHLTYATVRMREFIGLNQFPKYPLNWLIHRHITALGLPEVMHTFVKPLLKKLQGQCITISQTIQRHLLHLIPWPRVVRPEVFAMAFVVILLRLVFKLNDVFEASVKTSLSQPLRNLFRSDVNDPASNTQSQSTLHYQRNNDNFISDCSDNGIESDSNKFVTCSQYEQDGLLSPFRKTQLNYLYKKEINFSEYIPTSSSHNSKIIHSYGFDDCTIRKWWSDLLDQRYDYFSICTGEWSVNSSSRSQWKNRNRSKKSVILPKPVEDFIAKHDENASKALDNGDTSFLSEQHKNSSNSKDLENSEMEKRFCHHCCNPSRSLKWLVNLCAMVCGASNIKILLTEVECLERLLKWNAQMFCSVPTSRNETRHVDYAVLSFFDLSLDAYEPIKVLHL